MSKYRHADSEVANGHAHNLMLRVLEYACLLECVRLLFWSFAATNGAAKTLAVPGRGDVYFVFVSSDPLQRV
jgi:hypothetical protein